MTCSRHDKGTRARKLPPLVVLTVRRVSAFTLHIGERMSLLEFVDRMTGFVPHTLRDTRPDIKYMQKSAQLAKAAFETVARPI